MAAAKKPTNFDLAILQKMSEPIQIRIVRVDRASGARMPISLPQDAWSKEDAARIEQYILSDIAGGGNYEGEMTDVKGTSFSWKFAFPEQFFPPKVPGGQVSAFSPTGGNVPAAAPPGTTWSFGPSSVPYPMMTPPPPYQPGAAATPRMGYPQGTHMPPMSPFYGYNPYMYGNPAFASQTSQKSSNEDALRRELEQMRATALAAEHRREREAAEAQHRAELAELRRSIEDNKKGSDPNKELEMFKLQLQQQEQQRQRELEEQKRRDEEQRRRDEELRRRWEEEQRRRDEEQKRRWEEETKRREDERRREEERARREEDRRREERVAREAESRRWEMTFQMMTQQFSNNPMNSMLAETTRQLADAQRDSAVRAAEAPLKSMEMARMFKEMSGSDQLMKNITEAYSSAHGIGMRSLEMMNAMLMQQQGSPVASLIGEGMNNVKEVFQDYVTSKQKAEVANAKVRQMEAQERALREQAAAAQAHAQAMAAQAAAQQTPEAVAAARAATQEAQAAVAAHAEVINEATNVVQEAQTANERMEAREQEIFGVAYAEVMQLRAYVDSEGETDKVAQGVATGVVMAEHQINERQLDVPAFGLVAEGRYADLVDYLLPGASTEFRIQCAQEIEKLRQQVSVQGIESIQPVEPDDDDE